MTPRTRSRRRQQLEQCSSAAQIDSLARRFRGELIRPTNAQYDQARALYNGMMDKRPSLIARCRDVADVMAALDFARNHELRVAVLGGGHGYLSRRYGLTIDNLLEADVVLADGRLVTASERENADLFWALRGGGGGASSILTTYSESI